MIRWFFLIVAAFWIGNTIQNTTINSGVDVWMSRGIGIFAVAVVTLLGYLLFIKPIPSKR